MYTYRKLHLFKICLCCFLDIHLYSNNLSTIATISSITISELFPACFFCNNNCNLSYNSSGSDDRNIVFETPEAETIKPGDLSYFIRGLSRVDFLPTAFVSKCISFANSYINFLSCKLARSTLYLLLVIISKRSPSNSNSLPVSRKVNKLLYKVIGIVLCINKSLTLFELESFTSLNCVEF